MRRNPVASYGSLGLISFASMLLVTFCCANHDSHRYSNWSYLRTCVWLGCHLLDPSHCTGNHAFSSGDMLKPIQAFLLFGLGVDDTFVIMSTFERWESLLAIAALTVISSMSLDMPVRQRIARTMAMVRLYHPIHICKIPCSH